MFDNFLADGIVSSGKIIGSVFFARDELFRMVQTSVGPCSDLIDNCWLQIEEQVTRYVFAPRSFLEESTNSVIVFGRIAHDSVGTDAVLQTKQFPASIADLDSALADVQIDDFSHL